MHANEDTINRDANNYMFVFIVKRLLIILLKTIYDKKYELKTIMSYLC